MQYRKVNETEQDRDVVVPIRNTRSHRRGVPYAGRSRGSAHAGLGFEYCATADETDPGHESLPEPRFSIRARAKRSPRSHQKTASGDSNQRDCPESRTALASFSIPGDRKRKDE